MKSDKWPLQSATRAAVFLCQVSGGGRQLFHAFFHLFRRHVFLVSGDAPEMSKRILNEAGAISVKLVLDRLEDLGLLCHCLFDDLVAIGHVHVQTHGRSADAGGTDVALAHAGVFVRQHEARIADLQLGVTDLPVRTIHAHDYGGAEYILVIFDRSRSVLDDQVRSDGVVSLRNVMDFAHDFLLDNEVEGWRLRRSERLTGTVLSVNENTI